MFEALKISREILKKQRWFFALVFLISCGISYYDWSTQEPVYEASYVAAPYYETAADVTYKVKELAEAINGNNQTYINKNLSSSLNVHSLGNAVVKKHNKPADYTFKHIKVLLTVEVTDSNQLDLWDQELKKFYTIHANNPENQYRGREVLKERIKIISENYYDYDVSDENKEDDFVKLINFFFNRDSLVISDTNKIDLVFAQYLAEYRNARTVNEIITFNSSFHRVSTESTLIKNLVYIPFSPSLILLFLFSAYEESKRNAKD